MKKPKVPGNKNVKDLPNSYLIIYSDLLDAFNALDSLERFLSEEGIMEKKHDPRQGLLRYHLEAAMREVQAINEIAYNKLVNKE